MKLAVDTNILLRVVLRDDPEQTALAEQLLLRADPLIISTIVLCELAWTLRVRGYAPADIETAVVALTAPAKVLIDRPVVEADIAMLRRGGGFADSCILEMARRDKAPLATFDRRFVRLGKDGTADVETLLSPGAR